MTEPWQDLLSYHLKGQERVMVVEVGSTAHGTALDGADDFDICAIWVEPASRVVTWREHKGKKMYRTAAEGERSQPGDVDAQVYTLRAWLGLAAAGNPSILQVLWCPVLEDGNLGPELRALAPAFIGRHLINPYQGYMKSQVQRILGQKGSGHGTRGSGGRIELIEAHGYDTKYAMHAARLGFQCLELLTTGELTLPMVGHHGDWLRAVRRGEIPFDEWFEKVIELDAKLDEARSWDDVPPQPELERLQAWCTTAHLESWGHV